MSVRPQVAGSEKHQLSRRELIQGMSAIAAAPIAIRNTKLPISEGAKVVAESLLFPEGVTPLSNGEILFVEVAGGTVSKVTHSGKVEVVARVGGGPNGVAVGPDGAYYVTNNGGITFRNGRLFLEDFADVPADYKGGSIQRVDPRTGRIDTLYTAANGETLRGPNDLVFDEWGGFWFTDNGKLRGRRRELGGLYWARPDGSTRTPRASPARRETALRGEN